VPHLLLEQFQRHPLHQEVINGLHHPKSSIHWKGINASALALHIASLCHQTSLPQWIILNDRDDAEVLLADLENVLGERDAEFYKKSVIYFPSPYKTPDKPGVIDNNNVLMRTEVLKRLSAESRRMIIVTHVAAVSDYVVTRGFLRENTFRLKRGEPVDLDFVTDFLMEYAFERVDFVAEPGQFAIRGGIVDVFSFSNDFPYRIEFHGDEVGSIRSFDPISQLSKDMIDHITIVPNLQLRTENESRQPLFGLIPPATVTWVQDPVFAYETLDKFESFQAEQDEGPDAGVQRVSREDFRQHLLGNRTIELGSTPTLPDSVTFHADQSPQPAFNKKFDLLLHDLVQWSEKGYALHILSDNPKQIERIRNIFSDMAGDAGLPWAGLIPSLHHGFTDHHLRLVCYTDHQIFERYRKTVLQDGYKRREALTIKELLSLQPGDYVTHIDHGIGRFDGLETIENNGRMQEAIRLFYSNNDIVYVSIHSLHRIARYSGKEGAEPRLDKLGSGVWKRLKEKAKSRVKDIARDLIKLYAKRMASKGFAYSPDTYLQHELEASFIYEDTPDQIKATADLKSDMEKSWPMDRLICGDVGFGKTEVAIRAAFKAVSDSKQVAVLVPTTILALQHYHTFRGRLKEFPVNIDYINRFRSAADQKEILGKLEAGKIDIIIGTHRLVGKDVKFKDLGLLIVDEEQKFGVAVKEKLKQFRINVDTLTLTATPIPRTLQFSLMGARDLSVISTPPPNRFPVHTELRGFSEELIHDAIQYELNRGGQVFFLHNRIQNINDVADMVARIVPGVSVGVGHGQMEGEKLERIMLGFIEGNFDVLVSTSIIESGLDIPNANTIIINDAHMYGLSDLHQLRGRVGRSNKKAYCYLITPPLSGITPEARKRLKAIEEFSDLGSGFNIAMRDLDIRGAGNILGAEQSGFISDIGYEMYQKILREAMEELRISEFPDMVERSPEKAWKPRAECQIETDLEILLPADYIESTAERLLLYRELDEMEQEQELIIFKNKLTDRFGPLPPPAEDLLRTIRLRWIAAKLGFEKIILKNNRLSGYFPENPQHPFYESNSFNTILDYVKNHPKRCVLKEKNGKLNLILINVSSVSDAISALNL
jgi:transcription-repair coupling factor (superfamily II helicase)